MTDRRPGKELPPEVQWLIELAIPTTDALELLMFLVRRPDIHWTDRVLFDSVHSTAIAEPLIAEYLSLFRSRGILAEDTDGYWFDPASPRLAEAVRNLVDVYRERPVTLIRAVYAIADAKNLRALADAFRVKKEDEP